MNLDKFKQYLKLNTSSKNTRINYLYQVKKFFDNFDEFNQDSVDEYIEMRVDAEVAKSTLNQTIKALKQYTKFTNIDVKFPSIKREDKRVRTFITLEELEKQIVPYLPLMFGTDYFKRELILKFLFFTGLRSEEILTLKRENIDLDNRTILIKNTKGKVDRVVKFTSKLQKIIQSYFNTEPENGNAFNISQAYIKWTLKRISKELGLKKNITPHALRHGFAKHCLRQGMGIERLQKLLGHSDLKTTMIYANPTQEEALKDYDKYIK